MSGQRASLIGFDGVRFRPLPTTNSGVYPDWSFGPLVPERLVPGSGTSIMQVMGTPAATITLRLAFDDVPSYRRLVAKLPTPDSVVVGTLTLLANFTSAVGRVETVSRRDYEHLDGVTLVGIGNVAIFPDKTVECDATFRRAMNTVTGREVSS